MTTPIYTVTILHNFIAGDSEELTVSVNDILDVLEGDGDWLVCQNTDGHVGYVPVNVTQKIEIEEIDQVLYEAKVKAYFYSQDPEELNVNAGDLVQVLQEDGDWCVCSKDGNVGYIGKTNLDKVVKMPSGPPPTRAPPPPSGRPPSGPPSEPPSGRPPSGPPIGVPFRLPPPPNTPPPRSTPSIPPPRELPNSTPPRQLPPPTIPPPRLPNMPPPTRDAPPPRMIPVIPPPRVTPTTPPPREIPTPSISTPIPENTIDNVLYKATVIKNFVAGDSEELSISVGDVISVLEANGEWYVCEKNGDIGYVPSANIESTQKEKKKKGNLLKAFSVSANNKPPPPPKKGKKKLPITPPSVQVQNNLSVQSKGSKRSTVERHVSKVVTPEELSNRHKSFVFASVDDTERTIKQYQQERKIQVVSSGPTDLPTGPELDRRRKYIADELLQTEKSYLVALRKGQEIYNNILNAIPTNSDIPKDKVDLIFGELSRILTLNEGLCSEIQDRMDSWHANSMIGDIFKRMGPFLKLYSSYSSAYRKALEIVEEVEKDSWFVEHCRDGVHIGTQLICPIQRIPRYALMLEDLFNNTPTTHPDCENLKQSISIVREVSNHMNEALRTDENTQILSDDGLEFLMAPHRKLTRDVSTKLLMVDELMNDKKPEKKKIETRLYLFNDIFVSVEKKKKQDDVIVVWPLGLVWMPEEMKSNTSFFIIGPGESKLFQFQSAMETDDWFELLVNAINAALVDQPDFSTFGNTAMAAMIMQERIVRFESSNGDVYNGWWNRGLMHGEGKWEFEGCIYNGEFFNHKKSGTGKLKYPNGEIYAGSFENNLPHGDGELICSEFQYTGQWRQGLRHGNGSITYANGDTYEGSWNNDFIEGEGSLSLTSGFHYKGYFVAGKFSGQGKLEYLDGAVYEGAFQNGLRHGYGIMTYANGNIYDGNWKEGRKNGKGIETELNVGTYDGQFSKDKRNGKGFLDYTNGSRYDGEWKENEYHGVGRFTTNPSSNSFISQYDGHYVRGRKEGKGTAIFSNGDKYEGIWQNDLMHSEGNTKCTLTYSTGKSITGRWKHGARETKVVLTLEKGESVQLNNDITEKGVQWHSPPLPPLLDFNLYST